MEGFWSGAQYRTVTCLYGPGSRPTFERHDRAIVVRRKAVIIRELPDDLVQMMNSFYKLNRSLFYVHFQIFCGLPIPHPISVIKALFLIHFGNFLTITCSALVCTGQ